MQLGCRPSQSPPVGLTLQIQAQKVLDRNQAREKGRRDRLVQQQGLPSQSARIVGEEANVSLTCICIAAVGDLDLTLELRLDDVKVVIRDLGGVLALEGIWNDYRTYPVLGWKGDNDPVDSTFKRTNPVGHFVCLKIGISRGLRRLEKRHIREIPATPLRGSPPESALGWRTRP